MEEQLTLLEKLSNEFSEKISIIIPGKKTIIRKVIFELIEEGDIVHDQTDDEHASVFDSLDRLLTCTINEQGQVVCTKP